MSLTRPPLPPPLPYTPKDGDLFISVLPLVHYSRAFGGASYEEVMTLVPDRNFATEFSPTEVDNYINTFRDAAEPRYGGGPARRFHYSKHPADYEGTRIFVVVNQNG